MTSKVWNDVRERADTIARFFAHDIWVARLDELPSAQAFRYQSARVAHATLRSLLFEDGLHVRAAALTYYTVLSIVPLLAFIFALLKGFGAYELLVEESIRPYVLQAMSGNAPLRSALEHILDFVANTGVTSLGLVGLLTLLYAATRLLHNIEIAFNEVWEVSRARSTLEQMRDYLALIVITPICLMGAAALTTLGQALPMLRSAGDALGVSAVLEPVIGVLGPLTVLFLGLGALYMVMPNTRVRPLSAVLGAVVAGVGWFGLMVAHVRFQIGVARFNALYSSFGAVPIFLAWLQLSWVVILAGARAAATHQRTRRLAQHERLPHADQALREQVCLAAILRMTRAFQAGAQPVTIDQLCAELDVPEVSLTDWLSLLVRAGALARSEVDGSVAFVLAIAPERIHLKDILDALRHDPPRERDPDALLVNAEARELWNELDCELARSPANRSLRELARIERADAPPHPRS